MSTPVVALASGVKCENKATGTEAGHSRLYSILEHNARFVEKASVDRAKAKAAVDSLAGAASKTPGSGLDAPAVVPAPRRRIAIVSCMDARLVEMLPAALDLHNADAKVIKTAGAILTHPFGGIMRSIIVAIYALRCEEVMIVGHHDCGMSSLDPSAIISAMHDRGGVTRETVSILERAGINVSAWLTGFDDVKTSVCAGVDMVRRHPLVPASVPVHGLVIDPATGALDLIVDGNLDRADILSARGACASEPRITTHLQRSSGADASVRAMLKPA